MPPGQPTTFALRPQSPAPTGKLPQIRGAYKYLSATHESVSGVLESFDVVRSSVIAARSIASGRLSRDQVDLLRAALVFTSSGLDATCHRLVHDAAPGLVLKGGAARVLYDLYLKDQLGQERPPEGLLAAIQSPDPRQALLDRYVASKAKGSFQGSKDLRSRVRDLLGIPKAALPDARFTALDPFFEARNQIVHQLDYQDPNGQRTARHHRAPSVVVAACDGVLALAGDLISKTADLVR